MKMCHVHDLLAYRYCMLEDVVGADVHLGHHEEHRHTQCKRNTQVLLQHRGAREGGVRKDSLKS